MSRFEKNLSYFAPKNPRAAALLSFTETSHITTEETACGEETLRGPHFFYHSSQGAFAEQEALFLNRSLTGIDVLYIFGIGLGYAYDVLIPWLAEDESRHLIFLEDDLAVIAAFLNSPRASSLLKNQQVHLAYIDDSDEGRQTIQALAWGVFPKRVAIEALPVYAVYRKDIFENVKKRIFYETSELHAVLDEYLGFGVPFFRNFWKNIFFYPEAHRGSALFSQFRGIPAIVVAAGPSLQEALPLLKEVQDRALIFAGGSSINALLEAGIEPHFACGIDPNPMQYVRLRQAPPIRAPFFYRNRMLHEALRFVQGEKLSLPGGDGYNISDYFEKELKIGGKVLGGGHSVSNFLVEIAHALGCGPILLVGYDLAYSKNLVYAPGIEEEQSTLQVTAEKHSVDRTQGPIPWKDIHGSQIFTEWKWVVESEWIAEYKEKHPRLKVYNTTGGGIGMRGVPCLSLANAMEKYLVTQYDLQGKIHRAIAASPKAAKDAKRVLECLTNIYDSLDRVVKLFDRMIDGHKISKKEPFFETAEGILLFEELEAEDAYQYILEVFCRMKIKLDFMHMAFYSHPDTSEKSRLRKEEELSKARILFLKETALVNQLLIAEAVREYMEGGHSIAHFCPKAKVCWS